ncbi:MAG: peptidoglycan DD-metalloendopeptidase family protein [Desulfobulbaceae bacterium]|jgi:septal ring factor EnvC (AmiA/AmiB activator)|nr:peptidoglycan DD-metalloendopeptidase family protein [Desulfobulbaceae bacterium]
MARFSLFCLALFFFSLPTPVFAADGPFLPPDEVGARQDEFEHKRLEIERLKDSINEQQRLRSEDEDKEKEIVAKLESIGRHLAERMAKAEELGKQIAGQEETLRKLDAELEAAGASKDEAMRHLMRRVRAFYPVGKVGLFAVTFSRGNMPDLMKFHEAFTSLIAYDEHVLNDYRKKYEQLRTARQSQRLEQAVLQDFLASMKEEQAAIEVIKREQELVLEQVRTQVGLRQQVIKEMDEAAAKMAASLRADIRKEQDKTNDFMRFKGKLPPPLQEPVICRFGATTTDKMGITKKSRGLVFAAHDGETVWAVAPGEVLFASYLFGYGNTVIIHHGEDFYTVTARLERLDRAKGDAVKAGDAIGAAGATAMLVDEGLYFELRQGQEPIDPTLWFDGSQISFATLPALQ